MPLLLHFSAVVLAITSSCMHSSLWANAAALENLNVIEFLKDVQRAHGFELVLVVRNRNATLAAAFMDEDAGHEHQAEQRFLHEVTEGAVAFMDEDAGYEELVELRFLHEVTEGAVAFMDEDAGYEELVELRFLHELTEGTVAFMDEDAGHEHPSEQRFLHGLTEGAAAFLDEDADHEHPAEQRFLHGLMEQLQVSVLLVSDLQVNEVEIFPLHEQFSDRMMVVVVIDGAWSDHTALLKKMLVNLQFMRLSKILFLLNYAEVDDDMLVRLFHFCWQHKVINVAALFVDFQASGIFYSYTHFPEFEIESHKIRGSAQLYPYRLQNLKGYKLPYIVGGSEPRMIIYYNKNGEQVLGGFVGHFFHAFAKKYNCTFVEPLPSTEIASAQQLLKAVRNGTAEISTAITFFSTPVGYTYPYEQLNWCLIMPVEPDVPGYRFFLMVFKTSALVTTLATMVVISLVLSRALYQHGYTPNILDLFLHDNCLRGFLGQSFYEVPYAPMIVRFIYLQICILGILLTTSYNASFATFVTSAPKEAPLRTLDDMKYAGKQIFVWEPEFEGLLKRTGKYRNYSDIFHREEDFQEYIKFRDSFNTEYGYVMPTTKWAIFNEQQKFFTSPIFRIREEFCFLNNIPMGFVVHENSIYKQTLFQLILELAAAGLPDFWQSKGFLELVEAKKLNFTDLSKKKVFESLKLEDLEYIWIGMGLMAAVVTLVFLVELYVDKRMKVGERLEVGSNNEAAAMPVFLD